MSQFFKVHECHPHCFGQICKILPWKIFSTGEKGNALSTTYNQQVAVFQVAFSSV
jgi:hypothetical protein